MILFGFYIGRHDSNVALSINGQVKYAKSERLTGIKHHRADVSFVKQMCDRWGIRKPDAVAFSDGNRNELGTCGIDEIAKPVSPCFDFLSGVPTFCIDHHYGHILSAWPLVPTEKVDVGIAIDGNGDNGFSRRVIARPGDSTARSIYASPHRSFGMVLEKIGTLMNLGGHLEDLVGKVMGAQAYGEIDYDYVDSFDLEDVVENRVYDLILKVPWRGVIPEPNPVITQNPWPVWSSLSNPDFFKFSNPSFRDWLATIHHVLERYTLQFFKKFCRENDVITYAGGCAQNVVCNEVLSRNFPNLFIPPHGYDGGISLGCLEFLRLHYKVPPFSTEGFPYWQEDKEPERPTVATMKRVAELLGQGKIVGWFQGRGEIGPRALGHRSILMDPRNKNAKEIINSKIKRREPWRPYAPSVLASHASDWFELEGLSQYMLRSVAVRNSKRAVIPAVVHEDGSSRVQTVLDDGDQEPTSFAALLAEFHKLTGVPLLLNTSLNSGGSPIFSSAGESLDFFKSIPMDAICIGNELYVK